MKSIPSSVLKKAYRLVLDLRGRIKPSTLKEKEVRRLIQATNSTLSEPLSSPVIERSIPPQMLRSLQDDTFIFSGFKTYNQLREASARLLTQDGQVKDFDTFYQDTKAVRDNYNKHYLRAEYNYAVRTAEQTARWCQLTKDGDEYNLLYQTIGDDRVRPEHQDLEGICLPPSDPFWATAYPPNGWNCRCSVRRVFKEDYPTSSSEEAAKAVDRALPPNNPAAAIFRFNPAMARGLTGGIGRLFPPHHPYYGKGDLNNCNISEKLAALPQETYNELRTHTGEPYSQLAPEFNGLLKHYHAALFSLAAQISASTPCQTLKTIEEIYQNENNKVIPTENGKVIEAQHVNPNERDKNITTAKYLANKYGYEILVLPAKGVGYSADTYNVTLKRKEEYKHIQSNSYNAFDKNLQKAAKQANHVVYIIKGEYSKGELKKAIKDRFTKYSNLQSIRIIHNYKEDITIQRESILQDDIPL